MRSTKKIAIPIKTMTFITGTWAESLASNVPVMTKNAADETSTVTIPLPVGIPSKDISSQIGIIPKKVFLPYSVATADLDAVVGFKLYKVSRTSAGVVSAAEITSTVSGNVKAQGNNVAVLDVSTEALVNAEDSLHAVATIDAAAGSVVVVKPAVFEFIEKDYSTL